MTTRRNFLKGGFAVIMGLVAGKEVIAKAKVNSASLLSPKERNYARSAQYHLHEILEKCYSNPSTAYLIINLGDEKAITPYLEILKGRNIVEERYSGASGVFRFKNGSQIRFNKLDSINAEDKIYFHYAGMEFEDILLLPSSDIEFNKKVWNILKPSIRPQYKYDESIIKDQREYTTNLRLKY